MRKRSLTQDPRTGKYDARVQVDGVRKKFYFSKNRREAELELRQLEAELAEGDKSLAALAKYFAWVKKFRGKSANGGNRHMREVKTAFRWGEDMDICECPVRRFPVMREAPAKTKKYTDDELPLLLKHAQPDFRDLILFGLLPGLRPQELRGLCREHIRRVGQSLCVVLEKHKASMSMQIAQPRCVPL